ncbi:bifunctional methylenetetrahydrofolate dehydrogenase/methenyltetrahydrofolate cyclohydrolase FolD [Virgibacillus sp. MSP4-1]|uniref:bifunctional methylenetetrahydrofolate dehydrogenase/methenyltetrahydrofolate cyclohydrolase FolD n=1 Tax=Virgibacillus sp. MSP4-1 TaxID=2700081 RepID=UPI0003A80E61|nr:bifunctional methylenetetrahydrofolate dehydrogenase/methenyltetrahydrofolate cyclohydrolase FolD [Virgibacillus sp. MSP4-1]QHS22717.1 bifunctional methylenetetrahydrofolate dehydrogenase/methenyltetrahydrofolate cyclohydrolase FolD [Virgibacillus sp. MSP4-1]
MTAEIIYGSKMAEEIREQLKVEVKELEKKEIHPGLTVVIVGDNPASKSYVKFKQRACEKAGIRSSVIELPEETTQEQLLQHVNQLNEDSSVHGILVQLPLPEQIDEKVIIESIAPEKDVDGFHPYNIGRLQTNQDAFVPCTPLGILELIKKSNISIKGKHVVVVGRSNIVGKPVGQLFLNEHATVTYCHSVTEDLGAITRQADILIVAVGKANMIGKDAVKEGAVVVDVGNNYLSDGSLAGDVDFESVKEAASYITPVPKGVGPMTITMLLRNTLKAAKQISS